MTPYEVRLAPAATRAFRTLPLETRERLRGALEKLANDAGKKGRIPGKAVKTLRGVHDQFHRLRVGDHRVMYDAIDEDRVILVLGIVHRSDLERWIRNR